MIGNNDHLRNQFKVQNYNNICCLKCELPRQTSKALGKDRKDLNVAIKNNNVIQKQY